MGVPKFFRYISERYPCLSELVRENQVPEFDNLYLDMNGIIHNCSHPNDGDVHFRITEEQIFKDIFFYLETLFNMIKPQKLFFLAVDGVAPRAKMNQQRGRRFRSAKDAELQEQKAREKGEVLPEEARFDSNCITPGTPFMCRLDLALRYFIQYKISSSKAWRNCKVILSGHETPGEGEHKIMEYIRYMKAQKGFDPNTRHCLYGLDADLVMLGLCTHERHFSLLREEVKFGKKNNKAVSVSQQRFFLLHLSLLREYLEQEFIAVKDHIKFPFDIEKIIDDWVMMGFLVGNDFIPHIPNLHIHTNALPMLYDTYIKVLPMLGGYINEGGTLNLSRLQKFIEQLAEFDRDNFSSTYDDLKFLESKHQSGFNQRNTDTFNGNSELLDLIKQTEFEFDSPEEEEGSDNVFNGKEKAADDEDNSDEDTFEKEFHQHRRDYYVNKLKYEEMTPAVLQEQAEAYITAIQWTLSYYYHGVQSWSWYYPHHYAPFISDLKNFKEFKFNFDVGKPFLPFQQLMSVLPAASRDHVPECYKKLMTDPNSELIDFYPVNFETDLNGKNQEWEAVVLIPFIEEERLLKALHNIDSELSSDEKARNVHGPMYVFTYSNKSLGTLTGPTDNFPSSSLFCEENKLFRDDVIVPKDKLILGPSKGALLNIYYVGFPTLKHLNYSSELRLQHVKVFDQPSRGDNMIIKVTPNEHEMEKPIDIVVSEMMGKIVYVGWPHLMEAKVVRIADKDLTFFSDGRSDKTDSQRFRSDVTSIKDHHKNRMGIDVGEVERVVHVLQATGEEYRFDSKSKVFRKIKTWNKVEAAYPLQCVVSNIKAYRKKMKEELPVCEAFKIGTEVFMITNPYYGTLGEVSDTNCFESNSRIKVILTVPREPNFDKVMNEHHKSQESYMNSYQAASQIGISDNVLNRITGSVLIIAGMKRQVAENQSKHNIGLQMKFTRTNEELTGYTKRSRMWLYSNKTVEIVREYVAKFPQVFSVMEARSGRNNNDVYFESDFFPETEYKDVDNLQTLLKWLKELPSQKAERRQIGTEAVEKETYQSIIKEVENLKGMPMNRITMQVKPHLLYAPSLSKSTPKAPDYQARYEVFDRVVIAREMEQFPIGLKGTVVGVSKVKDLNPVRQDCVNKEEIFCDILFDNEQKGRLPVENLINISYGISLSDGNADRIYNGKEEVVMKEPPKQTESFSKILQKQPKQQVNAQANNNFLDIWNELKSGSTPSTPPNKPVNNIQQATTSNNKEMPKKTTGGLNKKMAEVTIGKKKTSPVPTDQSVPIMISPPTKLPSPPIEWLQPENRPRMAQPPFQMVQAPMPVYPVPHPIMMQQPPPMRQQQFYPVQRPMPYFPQNQPIYNYHQQQQQQQPQRCYFNNNINNNPNRAHKPQYQKFYRQQSLPTQPNNMQQMQYQDPQAQHQNPFIPLQAARKSTKGKEAKQEPKIMEVPSKDVMSEPPKKQIDTQQLATTSQSEQKAKKESRASDAQASRKSRLAIKF